MTLATNTGTQAFIRRMDSTELLKMYYINSFSRFKAHNRAASRHQEVQM